MSGVSPLTEIPDSPDPRLNDVSSVRDYRIEEKKTESTNSSEELEINGITFKLGESESRDSQLHQLKKIV